MSSWNASWKSLSEAKKKCFLDNECYAFYDNCGNGKTFRYCSKGAASKRSRCGSILYTQGNYWNLHMSSLKLEFDRHYQNLTHRFRCIYIGSKECVGDASTWNAGHGKCAKYAEGKTNNAYCNNDCIGGQCAYQVCQECGSSGVSGTFNSTVYTKTEYI